MLNRNRWSIFVALVCTLLVGCAGATRNVRAFRAHSREPSDLRVASDRIDDLEASLDLVDRMLTRTPYRPGAPWIEQLPLNKGRADKLRAELRRKPPYDNYDFEVPVLKLWRVHVERVLEEAPAPASGSGSSAAKAEQTGALPTAAPALAKQPADDEIVLEEDPEDTGERPAAPPPDAAGSADGEDESEEAPESAGEASDSILAALAELSPDAASLRKKWKAYQKKQVALIEAVREEEEIERKATEGKPPQFVREKSEEEKAAEAKVDAAEDAADAAGDELVQSVASLQIQGLNAKQQQIAKDALTVVSVATRIELEALAMVPIVAVQAARGLPKPDPNRPNETVEVSDDLASIPARVGAIEAKMSRQVKVLVALNDALAVTLRVDPDNAPGFQMKDSAVDEIAGVTLDSLRINVSAGFDALYYSQVQSEEQSSSENRTVDYTGRQAKLEYDVEPIILARAGLSADLDWIQLPDAVGLDFGYATDRVFKSGGEVENTSLARQLGATGVASEALSLGLAVLGVKTSVRIATFTTGEVRYVDVSAATPTTVFRSPLTFSQTRVDVGYDISFLMGEDAGKYYIEELTIGGRYLDYELPRILYELEDTDPSPERENLRYLRESPPQNIRSKYYLGGINARAGFGDDSVFSPYLALSLYFGGGPTEYYFIRGIDQPTIADDAPAVRTTTSDTALAADLGGEIGARYELTAGGRFRLNAFANYYANLIAQAVGGQQQTEEQNATQINYGGADLFHGVTAGLTATF